MLERPPNSVDPANQLEQERSGLRSQGKGRTESELPIEPQTKPQSDLQSELTTRLAPDVPPMTNTELVQLHVRVIALENLVIALLAEGSDRQVQVAREMAAYIAPRPGFTRHPLTVDGANQMLSLVDRARHFRSLPPA